MKTEKHRMVGVGKIIKRHHDCSCILQLEKVDSFIGRWNSRQKGFVHISTNMKRCFVIGEENLFQNMEM